MAVGKIIRKFVLNLFFICVFCVWIDVMVVLEIKDRLFLNIVLLMMVVIVIVFGMFSFLFKLVLIGVIVVIVFIDVFIDIEMK